MTLLDSRTPEGPVAEKWENHKFSMKLVNPNNKRRFEIIVVGTGLAGAAAAASLSELGYRVKVFTFHDSPRRAHSIAAQGGINAAKNYTNDGDSVHRLFYDPSRGATIEVEKQTFIDSQRFPSTSSIKQQLRVCRSPANTAVCLTTDRLEGRRSAEHSTPVAKQANSCCWGRTRR